MAGQAAGGSQCVVEGLVLLLLAWPALRRRKGRCALVYVFFLT